MTPADEQPNDPSLDVLIIGGGAAGLWLLDDLYRAGFSALLLEAYELGGGQTVGSQGIIHGGLKYSLKGVLTGSGDAIKEMPAVWRHCLAGQARQAGRDGPDLSATQMRAQYCYLWQTESIMSRVGMIGAKAGLRVKPVSLKPDDRPAVLANCPGRVDRLDEQVLSPPSLIRALANQHQGRILKFDFESGLRLECSTPGGSPPRIDTVELTDSTCGRIRLRPRDVVLTAGAGNSALRKQIGLDENTMQRRPLHMAMVAGPLPKLNGHCVDGRTTRLTITSDTDSQGRTVWQLGGQIAEDGVPLTAPQLVEHAQNELRAVLPGIDLTGTQWTTYRVDRAENKTRGGKRPENVFSQQEGNVITAWPTKLALVPVLSDQILQQLKKPSLPYTPDGPAVHTLDEKTLADWPRPQVAKGPWETAATWYDID